AKGAHLRHQNAQAVLSSIATAQDSQDARFKKVPGLAFPRAVSFESSNYPGHYLRHKDGRLILTRCPTEEDRQDATFSIAKGLASDRDGWFSLELFTHPDHYVTNEKDGVWVGKQKDDEQYRKNATFRLVKAVQIVEPLKSGPQVGARNDRNGFRPQFVSGPGER